MSQRAGGLKIVSPTCRMALAAHKLRRGEGTLDVSNVFIWDEGGVRGCGDGLKEGDMRPDAERGDGCGWTPRGETG